MRRCALFLAVLAPLAGLVAADHDLVFPIVALGSASAHDTEFSDFTAQILTVQSSLTTYAVACATNPCAGWSNPSDFTYTIAIGSSTFDFKYSEWPISTHTACTFTGSPFPTQASCVMKNEGTILSSDVGYEHEFTVPSEDVTWELWNIMSATLRVVDGTVGATTTGSAGGSRETGALTAGPSATRSGNFPALGTGGTGSPAAAIITKAPIWAVGVGMGVAAGAGAVFGV